MSRCFKILRASKFAENSVRPWAPCPGHRRIGRVLCKVVTLISISEDVVKSAIAVSLSGDGPMIKRVAQRLNVSVRTLQRRLQEGGTSYTKLVDEIRFKLACHLLDAPRTSITDVAAAVGYGDPSSFSRIFARWSGMQPNAYRRLRARQGRSGAPPAG